MTSIIGLCRSPFCPINGYLSTLNSSNLITRVIESVIKRAHVDPKWVKSIFLGQVLPQLQNINTITKGLDEIDLSNANITTVNSLCNSGLSSIILANKMITNTSLSIAGGVDSISNSPYMIKPDFTDNIKHNDGVLYNSAKADYLSSDSPKLEYIFNNSNISPSEIDNFRIALWKRTLDTLSSNILEQEITPFKVKLASNKPDNRTWISPSDRIIHRDQLLSDKPKIDNHITPLVDGASAVVLSSEDFIKKHNLNTITRIISTYESKSNNLETTIKNSLTECLNQANLDKSRIDVYEFEDYITYMPLYMSKILEIDIGRVNLHGGSTAIGFNPGSSGIRLIISLTSVLRSRGLRYGCVMSVNNMGEVSTVILENPLYN